MDELQSIYGGKLTDLRFFCFELALGESSQAVCEILAPQVGWEQPCAHSRKATSSVSCPAETTLHPSCPRECSSRGPGEEELGFCGDRTKLLPLLSLQEQILPCLSARNLLQVYFIMHRHLSRASPPTAAGSASSPSPVWLDPCRGWWRTSAFPPGWEGICGGAVPGTESRGGGWLCGVPHPLVSLSPIVPW